MQQDAQHKEDSIRVFQEQRVKLESALHEEEKARSRAEHEVANMMSQMEQMKAKFAASTPTPILSREPAITTTSNDDVARLEMLLHETSQQLAQRNKEVVALEAEKNKLKKSMEVSAFTMMIILCYNVMSCPVM